MTWDFHICLGTTCSYEDLRAFLDTLTPIDDFIPITDDSYLTN